MSINLEEDKIDSLANANTNDIKELSNQVLKLRDLEDEFASKEEELKKLKNDKLVVLTPPQSPLAEALGLPTTPLSRAWGHFGPQTGLKASAFSL